MDGGGAVARAVSGGNGCRRLLDCAAIDLRTIVTHPTQVSLQLSGDSTQSRQHLSIGIASHTLLDVPHVMTLCCSLNHSATSASGLAVKAPA